MGGMGCSGFGMNYRMPEVLDIMLSPESNYACIIEVDRETNRVRRSETSLTHFYNRSEAEISFGSSDSDERIFEKVSKFGEVFSF